MKTFMMIGMAFLVLAACNQTSDWQTYSYSGMLATMTFEYPSEWKLEEDRAGMNLYSFDNKGTWISPGSQTGGQQIIRIMLDTQNAQQLSLAEWCKHQITSAYATDAVFDDSMEFSVQQFQGLKMLYHTKNPPPSTGIIGCIDHDGEYIYLIQVSSLMGQSTPVQTDVFEHILSTLQFEQ